ncbi:MAG: hypothetical protein ACTSPI_16620 [Candidatus Heimdallarchaeaceae archaeon]
MTKKELKLYVWEDVLCDYTCGMICILAHDLEEAVELLNKKYPSYYCEEIGKPYKVITNPEAFAVYGGG